MLARLTVAEARELPFGELLERTEELLAPYAPQSNETPVERLARLSRTLEEVPELVRWFLTLESSFDHWATNFNRDYGRNDENYQNMRIRRDAMERAASAAKLRYDGGSRLITVLTSFDEHAMPKSR